MGEIRFVGTGETRGYPYRVCRNKVYPYFGKEAQGFLSKMILVYAFLIYTICMNIMC